MFLKSIIVAGLAVVATGLAHADNLDTGSCVSDCTTMVVIGNTHHVVARGADGALLKVIDTGVSVTAKAVAGNSVIMQGSVFRSPIGEATAASASAPAVSSATYETETEIMTVVTVISYDDDGSMIDVQVNVFRTPKPRPNSETP